MTFVLRFFAVITALIFISIARAVVPFFVNGGLGTLSGLGLLGLATPIGWLVILLVGPIAAFKLWQRRYIGLVLTAALFGLAAIYYLVSILVGYSSVDGQSPIVPLIVNAASCALLLSPAARRACRK